MTETWYEKIDRIKKQLLYCSTGDGFDGPHDYETLRREWLRHPTLKHKVPDEIKRASTLSEFRTFSQTLGGYKERRAFIRDMMNPILAELEEANANPADGIITGRITVVDSDHIKEAWAKALERRHADPDGAITSARTLLETVCKHILFELGEPVDDKAYLPQLYGNVAKKLNLSPSQHTEPIFKQILGGCHSVVEGLGAVRNRHSDAHGKAPKAVKAAPRHAELSVNLAGSMAIFLLATLEARAQP